MCSIHVVATFCIRIRIKNTFEHTLRRESFMSWVEQEAETEDKGGKEKLFLGCQTYILAHTLR